MVCENHTGEICEQYCTYYMAYKEMPPQPPPPPNPQKSKITTTTAATTTNPPPKNPYHWFKNKLNFGLFWIVCFSCYHDVMCVFLHSDEGEGVNLYVNVCKFLGDCAQTDAKVKRTELLFTSIVYYYIGIVCEQR